MLSKILTLSVLWSFTDAQNRTLNLDTERSEISFSIAHMGFLTVEGVFGDFGATMTLEGDALSSIQGEIQVKSIRTNETTRDATLLSPSYLDSESFPTIQFSSGTIHSAPSGNQITGQLRIKSQEREVSIPCQINQKEAYFTLIAQLVIRRSKFNLDFGAMDALIGDEITVKARLTFEE